MAYEPCPICGQQIGCIHEKIINSYGSGLHDYWWESLDLFLDTLDSNFYRKTIFYGRQIVAKAKMLKDLKGKKDLVKGLNLKTAEEIMTSMDKPEIGQCCRKCEMLAEQLYILKELINNIKVAAKEGATCKLCGQRGYHTPYCPIPYIDQYDMLVPSITKQLEERTTQRDEAWEDNLVLKGLIREMGKKLDYCADWFAPPEHGHPVADEIRETLSRPEVKAVLEEE